jgi:phosphatidylserine/phosphatidylglycerophosphate/cardiolipin synthase-like enzyme
MTPHLHALQITPAAHSWPALFRVLVSLMLATWAVGCAGLPANVERKASLAFHAPDETVLGQLVTARRQQAAARADSAFRLLDSVEVAFSSRLALIQGAQRSLDLQYYAVHADASTEVLLQGLRDAARRGVRVRLLLDDFNTVGADAQVLRLAFEPNVEIRLFNPLNGSRSSMLGRIIGSLHDVDRIQKRMHNKLFIADNALGITGGRNLGDAYFGGTETSYFVDLDVLAAGRVVRDMSASFDRYWNNDLAYPMQALVKPGELDALRQPPEQAPAAQADGGRGSQMVRPVVAAPAPTPGQVLPGVTATLVVAAERQPMDLKRVALTWAPAALMVDKPGKIGPDDDEVDAGDTVVDGLLDLMGKARQEVLIISPYFVPGAEMMKVFSQARARGVRVRVLTNSLASNDAPAAHAGYARYRKALVAMGVELHEMRASPGGAASGSGLGSGLGGWGSGPAAGGSKGAASRASLHSKAVIIDRRLSIIGSMNLDLRSQLQNSEVALVIRSAALATQASRLVEATIGQNAYRLEQEGTQLLWRAPSGAPFPDERSEPEAGMRLRLLVRLLGPFAPEEML